MTAPPLAPPTRQASASDTLRFITCANVGAGQSTLIEQLLRETADIHRHPAAPQNNPRWLDPQAAEPVQGVASDMAYRYFATPRRSFMVADTDGHEQGTGSVVAAASSASVAVLLLDARKGLLTQTRRHSRIAALMGIRHVVLAVNKMDLVGYSEAVFQQLLADYQSFAADCGFTSIGAIALSALHGDNVTQRSAQMPWYQGLSLLEYLETIDTGGATALARSDEVGASRGDGIAAADHAPGVADLFEARLIWLGGEPLLPGRAYLLTLHNREVNASITAIKYREDIDTGAHLAAKTLAANEIATVHLSCTQAVEFAPFTADPALGSFILRDKLSLETVAWGAISFALRRAANLHWQALAVNQQARATLMQQRPRCIWFTGLSGSGKSTLANLLEKRLHAQGRHTYVLDGDNLRHGLNRDLGFTAADRVENIRRVAEVARLMVDAGLIVLVAFISPYRAERRMARELFAPGEFVEVFVDAPLQACEQRDTKGLYAKARRGELKNFTGIDSAYEVPQAPEIRLPSGSATAQECVTQLVEWLG